MNLKVTLVLLFLPLFLCAQQGDLTEHKAFFEAQAEAYDRWLNTSGLGELLSVKGIRVESNSLSIYLAFPDDEVNYVASAWDKLKAQFEEQEPLTLEQQLFYKALHYMSVDQELLDIQLADTHEGTKRALFFRGIYFSDGIVKVAEDNPKSVTREVSIPLPQLTIGRNGADFTLQNTFPQDFVFRRILLRAKAFYEAEEKKIDGREPVFKTLGQLEQLRFQVSDLTREVVTDGRRSYFCKVLRYLGHDCNWSPREVLTYTISYKVINDELVLEMKIDGRLGSGVYANARYNSYISLDVEHYPQLEAYAEEMRERIYAWLTQP